MHTSFERKEQMQHLCACGRKNEQHSHYHATQTETCNTWQQGGLVPLTPTPLCLQLGRCKESRDRDRCCSGCAELALDLRFAYLMVRTVHAGGSLMPRSAKSKCHVALQTNPSSFQCWSQVILKLPGVCLIRAWQVFRSGFLDFISQSSLTILVQVSRN